MKRGLGSKLWDLVGLKFWGFATKILAQKKNCCFYLRVVSAPSLLGTVSEGELRCCVDAGPGQPLARLGVGNP